MQKILLPQKPIYISLKAEKGDLGGRFVIEGCYPGYGNTLGNALRRVLLSSMDGVAITGVKIKGILHEFSTLDGVMEDMVQVILNLKKIRFIIEMEGEEKINAVLKHKGEGKVTAGEIKCPTGLKVVNTDQLIATITDKKTDLEMELIIERGLGYVPVEQQEREEKEIGVIAVDAIYTPIKRVSYEVENMRVGKRTDYEKIYLDIFTDGSLTPREAFRKAVKILMDQFAAIWEIAETKIAEEKEEEPKENKEVEKKSEMPKESGEQMSVEDLKNLSTRTLNALKNNRIKRVKDIVKLSDEELIALEGMGEKGVKEIKKALGSMGLVLKS